MHFSTAFAVVALAGLAQAQVPAGFKPSVNTKLEVIYNSSMIMEAGQLFGKADTVAHRYVQLLFTQPANLSVAKADVSDRVGFDIVAFMTKYKLAEPMAGNFLTVDGRMNGTVTGAAKATGTRGSPTASGTPPMQFQGAAGELSVPYGTVGRLGALALAVMFVL
ncbi:hypothetical protein CFE70_006395 [Pyrenophora teres f. teres 0-1]